MRKYCLWELTSCPPADSVEIFPVASATTFFTDMHYLLKVVSIGNVRSVCHHRLRFLDEVGSVNFGLSFKFWPLFLTYLINVQKYRVHHLLNEGEEFLAQKSAPHRDFYNCRKVDTHVHHSACMNQKHLLSFIKSKLKKEPDEVETIFLSSCLFQWTRYGCWF